ncbi:MAG: hypothetical protein M3N52_08820, partial [Actinomycetota bacterium]|nr:hypothetical protein [Actinomycetota bacterium]
VALLGCLVGAGGGDRGPRLHGRRIRMGAQAPTRSVPEAVFRLPRPQLELFLNRLFACGGRVERDDEGPRVTFTSGSATLVRQLQHLLLRFGVIAGVRTRHRPTADGGNDTAWDLQVTDPSSIRAFAREIGTLGGEPGPGATTARPSDRREVGASPSGMLPAQRPSVSHDVLLRPVAPDLYWDEIASIEPAGEQRVYDLTVPGDHNFVAADVVVHNSTLVTNVATNIAVEQRRPVVLFSLEMSQLELVDRILAAEARVDFDRLRTGRLHDSDWPKLSQAMGRLAEAPLFIDDSPGINVMEIRSKCRRLKQKHGLDLAIVDYLQLMQPHRRLDNRVQEVSELSRGLKILAKELDIPVVALSQLSRKPEDRTDRRPQLSDLRESGCLTADARVLRADSGAETTMGELYASRRRDIPVWTVDRDGRVVAGTMTHVFASGTKPVFALRLASGRQVKASANHPFLTPDGWRRLDELSEGSPIAVPARLGEPLQATAWADPEVVLLAHLVGAGSAAPGEPIRYSSALLTNVELVEEAARCSGGATRRARQGGRWQLDLAWTHPVGPGRADPIACWLQGLDRSGRRRGGRGVPPQVFGLHRSQVALFLWHLWSTDGHRSPRDAQATPRYASGSRALVDDLQLLLLRLGIHSHIRTAGRPGDQPTYELAIGDAEWRSRSLRHVGAASRPPAVGVASRATPASAGSSSRPGRASSVVADPPRDQLADADLSWDRVVALEALGPQPVFDATVSQTHNFIANNVVVHNSIEQDSDIVCFIYRDEVYNQDSAAKGEAELIVAKHRNGPLRTIRLSFIGHQARFASMARAPLPGGGPPRRGRPGAGPV